ncbi:hypothetical protein [Mycolicibacterium sphagni]|uniref:hypothetical protein n=1 Tax=Mycolicibacterium sphagni TaxID=1786 RepID=UPI0021F28664|nr:hypothetical protein [Mycolicibacterium sphagni]MCV7174982.1 hypothetical protein [Mycolicibacterium sphagni]
MAFTDPNDILAVTNSRLILLTQPDADDATTATTYDLHTHDVVGSSTCLGQPRLQNVNGHLQLLPVQDDPQFANFAVMRIDAARSQAGLAMIDARTGTVHTYTTEGTGLLHE